MSLQSKYPTLINWKVEGNCYHRRTGDSTYSGLPPFSDGYICELYKEKSKYTKYKRNECIFCEYWRGIDYDVFIREVYINVGTIIESRDNIEKHTGKKGKSIPKPNRFADIDIV
jgi:hypothetical protein